MPFFSIIIPTYNRADFVGIAIQSVLQQNMIDFEIIVVDDGSTDNTEEAVARFADHRVKYIKKANEERAMARNVGIANAGGRYITFLDSDDLVYRHHLEAALKFIQDTGQPPVFHQAYEIKDHKGRLIKRCNRIRSINKALLRGNPLSCIGVFVREDVMRENLFNTDSNLSSLEDWELWLRIAALHPFLNTTQVTSCMMSHEGRSVLNPNMTQLKIKAECFLKYVFASQANQRAYGHKLLKVSASVKTYVALHMAIARHKKKEIFQFLWKGICDNPFEILRKRFFVILKMTLFPA